MTDTPRRLRAWNTILAEDTEILTDEELAFARMVFRDKPQLAVEYLSFPKSQRNARNVWLGREIRVVMQPM